VREILITKRFKKDLMKAKKNPRQDTDKLLFAIETLAISGIVSEEYLPHCLSGNWKPKRECHVQPNFLLIYEVTGEVLRLERCGSHSELFE
jgi:mRNA interferase YafQ